MNKNGYYVKYLKYKQKYLELKGGAIDPAKFFNIKIDTLPPDEKKRLKEKFDLEFSLSLKIHQLFEIVNALFLPGHFPGNILYEQLPDKIRVAQESDEIYNEIIGIKTDLDRLDITNKANLESIIGKLKASKDRISSSGVYFIRNRDLTITIGLLIDKVNSIINIDDRWIIEEAKTERKRRGGFVFGFTYDSKGKLLEDFIKESLDVITKFKCYFDIDSILNYIKNLYSENFDRLNERILKGKIINNENIKDLTNEVLFNYLFTNINSKEKLQIKTQMFSDMAYPTLQWYSGPFEKAVPNSFLVSYDDQLNMFISKCTADNGEKFSEHIYITRLPSLYITSLINGSREPNVAESLHIYALSLHKPTYLVSEPLNIMKEGVFSKFVTDRLLSKTVPQCIATHKCILINRITACYLVNQDILETKISEHGF